MLSLNFWPFRRSGRRGRSPAPAIRAFIADDDPRIRAVLHGYLAERGFLITFAADGTALMRLLSSARRAAPTDRDGVDVIVADLDLPGRSGIDILISLREDRCPIPVVLTGSYISHDLRAELLNLGAAAVLDKPVCMPVLERLLLKSRSPTTG